jgi:hypothetical protein
VLFRSILQQLGHLCLINCFIIVSTFDVDTPSLTLPPQGGGNLYIPSPLGGEGWGEGDNSCLFYFETLNKRPAAFRPLLTKGLALSGERTDKCIVFFWIKRLAHINYFTSPPFACFSPDPF